MKTQLFKSIAGGLLFAGYFLLTSCSTFYYAPNAVNVPMLRQKNQFTLSGGISTGNEATGNEFQGSFAATDHLGIIANSYFSTSGSSGRFFEAGAGYFTPVDSIFSFEVYGGAGFGKFSKQSESSYGGTEEFFGNGSRYFVQSSFGFASRAFNAGISMRLCAANYASLGGNGLDSLIVNKILKDDIHFFAEPAFTFRFGYKALKIQLQLVQSALLSSPGFPIDETNLNLSLFLTFNELLKQPRVK